MKCSQHLSFLKTQEVQYHQLHLLTNTSAGCFNKVKRLVSNYPLLSGGKLRNTVPLLQMSDIPKKSLAFNKWAIRTRVLFRILWLVKTDINPVMTTTWKSCQNFLLRCLFNKIHKNNAFFIKYKFNYVAFDNFVSFGSQQCWFKIQ